MIDRTIETHSECEVSTPKIVCQRGMCTDAGKVCREKYERWQDVQRDRDVVQEGYKCTSTLHNQFLQEINKST